VTEKARIDLTLILPAAPVGDACYRRLVDLFTAKVGIEAAHLLQRKPDQAGELCVHFDPDVISVQAVRRLAGQGGAKLTSRFGHYFADMGAVPPGRARRIAAQLTTIEGVLEAAVSADGEIRIEFDRNVVDEAQIQQLLETTANAKKPVTEPDSAEHAHATIFGFSAELIFVAMCGLTLLLGWSIATFGNVPGWVPQSLLVATYFFGGWFTFREAIQHLRVRQFEIDTLMLVAAVGAAILGEWAEGALLLFLFSLGHALEAYAMGRAKRAIEALADLAPRTARVRRSGDVTEISVDDLIVGDIVVIRPNERLPADGFVIKGESSVDQAPITGESVPVDKQPVADAATAANDVAAIDAASIVFAGTVNGSGVLECFVTRTSTESTLARVVKMVREAETSQSPTQQFTDRFERIFTPTVLLGAVLTLLVGLVIDDEVGTAFYRAMALLVAASPCALAIATPSAVLSGIARAARGGVLIKGGGPLESLGRLRAIAFDKTGTLTEGRPRLVDVRPAPGVDENELLQVAVAVEALSDHPLAAAVVQDGQSRLGSAVQLVADDLQSITGRGLQAEVDGLTTHIGKDDLFNEVPGTPLPPEIREVVDELESAGRTTMIVRHGPRYLGVLGLMDQPRSSARAVIARLRKLGIRRMIMISGDNQKVAEAVASTIGLTEARGDLMPDDKVDAIRALRSEADVAMVGDGVNDAPAMANATVGIAMGAAGSDVALETADVALMADELRNLPFAVGLSRATSRIIRQNLWLSLGIVAILVPTTLGGLSIGAAVLIHEGSTVVVVFNALRLLAYRSAELAIDADIPAHEALRRQQ